MNILTHRQNKVLSYIHSYIKDNGFPPTYADIKAAFNFKSDGTVRTYLEHLENKNYILRHGKARAIKIIKPPEQQDIPIFENLTCSKWDRLEAGTHVNRLTLLQYSPEKIGLRVQDDRMKDAGIIKGDIALIESTHNIHNGQIAAILIDKNPSLARIYYEKDQVRLQSENECFDSIYIDRDVAKTHFIGVYIGLVRCV